MLWVAVDDTDSRAGGCTTFLVDRILAAFPERGLAGAPRLVRLNPGVPWKTRGNAAVAVPLTGPPDVAEACARLAKVVAADARVEDPETHPGWAAAPGPVDAGFYDAAVSRVVTLENAEAALADAGAAWGGLKTARGVIGCAGALAWPARRTTWEWIAYRAPERWGTPRAVDAATVVNLDRRFPGTFDSYDHANREVVMAPASPCPVLWGVRATTAAEAARAAATVRGEAAAGATLFLTNHGSDDHLRPATCVTLAPRTAAVLRCRVTAEPEVRGGHVFVPVEDHTGAALLAAYAPTARFREVVAALAPGDEVTACGGVADGPTLNLEKMRVDHLAPRHRSAPKPRCPTCGRTLKSTGRGGGLRCRSGCGVRAPREVEVVAAPLTPGWYEVPPRARRHLARPLRLGAEHIDTLKPPVIVR